MTLLSARDLPVSLAVLVVAAGCPGLGEQRCPDGQVMIGLNDAGELRCAPPVARAVTATPPLVLSEGNVLVLEETDPRFAASPVATVTAGDLAVLDALAEAGDHAPADYLSSEVDPRFSQEPAAGVTAADIANLDEAASFGDHATAGYFADEIDPTFTAVSAAGQCLATGGDVRCDGTAPSVWRRVRAVRAEPRAQSVLQEALTELGSTGQPALVKLGGGTFQVAGVLTVPTNVILRGSGRGFTTLTGPGLSLDLQPGAAIEHLSVDVGKISGPVIRHVASGARVADVDVTATAPTIAPAISVLTGATASTFERVSVRVTGAGAVGLDAEGPTQWRDSSIEADNTAVLPRAAEHGFVGTRLSGASTGVLAFGGTTRVMGGVVSGSSVVQTRGVAPEVSLSGVKLTGATLTHGAGRLELRDLAFSGTLSDSGSQVRSLVIANSRIGATSLSDTAIVVRNSQIDALSVPLFGEALCANVVNASASLYADDCFLP